jgi:Cu2+-exporting ATPase
MKSSLIDAAAAVRLSRATLRNIHENLFWAFFYNAICIPLAAGAYVGLGLSLNPMVGAAAMSLSSFCVVSNALRLNLFKLYDAKKGRKNETVDTAAFLEAVEDIRNNMQGKTNKKQDKTEERKMTKTLKIEGMMCGNCEKHVKKALEALEGVTEAKPSHEKNEAVVEFSAEVSDDIISAAITEAGYEYKGMA